MSHEIVPLSAREQEILHLVATGATNQQIAYQLDISPNTVKVHLRNIFSKIGVTSRTEAAVYATRLGLREEDFDQVAVTPDLVEMADSSATTCDSAALPGTSGLAIESTGTVPVVVGDAPLPEQHDAVAGNLIGTRPHARSRETKSRQHNFLLISLVIICTVLFLVVVGLSYRLSQQHNVIAPSPLASGTMLSERWRPRTTVSNPRTDFAVATYDGKMYIIGGSNTDGPTTVVERYDPFNNVWVTLNDKPTPVSHVQGATIGGRIYVPGGEGVEQTVLDVFEAYDPRNQEWQLLPPLPEPRSRYGLTSFEGRLYLFGGWDGHQYCDEVFMYDPMTEQWREGSSLPTPRRDAGAVTIEDRIFVIGGENDTGSLRTNERYDPTRSDDSQWTNAAPLPIAIATPSGVGVVNTALVFDPQTHSALQYSASTDAWTSIDIPEAMQISNRAVALGTSIFLFSSAEPGMSGLVSEYQAVYMTFLPNTTGAPKE